MEETNSTVSTELKEPLQPIPEDNVYLILYKQQIKSLLSTCYSICFIYFVLDFGIFLFSESEYFDNPCFIISEIAGWLAPFIVCVFLCKLHNYPNIFYLFFVVLLVTNFSLMAVVGKEKWVWKFKWDLSLYLTISLLRITIGIYLIFQVRTFLFCMKIFCVVQDRVNQLKQEIKQKHNNECTLIVPNIIKDTEEVIVEFS